MLTGLSTQPQGTRSCLYRPTELTDDTRVRPRAWQGPIHTQTPCHQLQELSSTALPQVCQQKTVGACASSAPPPSLWQMLDTDRLKIGGKILSQVFQPQVYQLELPVMDLATSVSFHLIMKKISKILHFYGLRSILFQFYW